MKTFEHSTMPALSEKQIGGNKLEESHKVTENACFNYRDACMCVYIYISWKAYDLKNDFVRYAIMHTYRITLLKKNMISLNK